MTDAQAGLKAVTGCVVKIVVPEGGTLESALLRYSKGVSAQQRNNL
jgi:hypothetical protein